MKKPKKAPDDGKKTTTISLARTTHAAVKTLATEERRTFSAQAEILIETALRP